MFESIVDVDEEGKSPQGTTDIKDVGFSKL
jgi:hypothetical protein